MKTIIQLSDTHFGTVVPEVMSALESAIAALAPEVILLVGDITQRARQSQFRDAAAFMARLPAPVKLAVPGNHDIPLCNLFTRFSAPYAQYQHAFGARETIWEDDTLRIIMLDATSPLRHTRGKVNLARARRLFEKKPRRPHQITLVAVHQPLVLALQKDLENLLIDANATAQFFAGQQTDIVLSGHVHIPVITTTEKHYPDLPRQFIISGSGTAISHRTRPCYPNAFNAIRLVNQKEIHIALWQYDAASATFQQKTRQHFHCAPQGWQGSTLATPIS